MKMHKNWQSAREFLSSNASNVNVWPVNRLLATDTRRYLRPLSRFIDTEQLARARMYFQLSNGGISFPRSTVRSKG